MFKSNRLIVAAAALALFVSAAGLNVAMAKDSANDERQRAMFRAAAG